MAVEHDALISLRLPRELSERLDRVAEAYSTRGMSIEPVSRSRVIREILVFYFDNYRLMRRYCHIPKYLRDREPGNVILARR